MHKQYNQATKFAIRSKFKQIIDIEDYRKLTHFAIVKKVKAPMPGTWQMYIFHDNAILCACNSLCINQWLYLHGQAKRRKLTQKAVDIKLKYNNFDTAIDNRTDEWTLHPIRKPYAKRTTLNKGKEMTRKIWNMYHHDGLTTGEIACQLSVTPPAIHYHLRKYEERELDKTTV